MRARLRAHAAGVRSRRPWRPVRPMSSDPVLATVSMRSAMTPTVFVTRSSNFGSRFEKAPDRSAELLQCLLVYDLRCRPDPKSSIARDTGGQGRDEIRLVGASVLDRKATTPSRYPRSAARARREDLVGGGRMLTAAASPSRLDRSPEREQRVRPRLRTCSPRPYRSQFARLAHPSQGLRTGGCHMPQPLPARAPVEDEKRCSSVCGQPSPRVSAIRASASWAPSVPHEPAADDDPRAPAARPAVHVHETAYGELRVDLVERGFELELGRDREVTDRNPDVARGRRNERARTARARRPA